MNNDEIITAEFNRRAKEWREQAEAEFIGFDNILYDEEKGLFLKLMDEARADEREKRNTEARLEAIMTETDIRKNERAKIKAELEKLYSDKVLGSYDDWYKGIEEGITRCVSVISSLDAEKED